MKTLKLLVSLVFLSTLAFAQDPKPETPPVPAKPVATIPAYPNTTCPVMGKRASLPLFVDTEMGRIYVCCKACNKKIAADPVAAHKTAFPKVKKVANPTCPISGEKLKEGSPTVTIQGHEIGVCCEKCIPAVRAGHQAVLVKVLQPDVKDLGNKTCPISGEVASGNFVVIIGDTMVRLSGTDSVDAARKDAQGTLEKARAIVASEKK